MSGKGIPKTNDINKRPQKEWVALFEVSGMMTSGIDLPEEIRIDDNMIIKRFKSKPKGTGWAYLRFTITEDEERRLFLEAKGYKKVQERLLTFASLFALWSRREVSFKDHGMQSIPSSQNLEDIKAIYGETEISLAPESLEEYTKSDHEGILRFIEYFKNYESRLEESYLKNAVHYFYYGITSDRLEEKIINFFIGIESLVGTSQELKYRMATRM